MKKPSINNFEKDKFIQEVKSACSADKPYVLFAHPEDVSDIKRLFPRIESEVYLAPYHGVERGEARAIKRETLKDWVGTREEFGESVAGEVECERWLV